MQGAGRKLRVTKTAQGLIMKKIYVALAAAGCVAAMPLLAQQGGQRAATPGATPHTIKGELKLYEMTNYNGDDWVIKSASATVRTDWNIRSISVHPGDRWQICARARYRDCVVLDRSLPDASAIGIVGQIGSARPAPAAAPASNQGH